MKIMAIKELGNGWKLITDAPFEHGGIVTPDVTLEDPKGLKKYQSFYTGGYEGKDYLAAIKCFTDTMPNGWDYRVPNNFQASALNQFG